MSRPRALIFDLDDTLCDTDGGDQKAILDWTPELEEEIGEGAEGVARRYLKAIFRLDMEPEWWSLRERMGEGEPYRVELLGAVARTLCGEVDLDAVSAYARFWGLRMHHYDFYEGVRAWLPGLRERYRTGVITNGPVLSQGPRVEKVGIRELVDEVIIAGEVGIQKPDPRVFSLIAERLNVPVEEGVFVGDRLDSDIQGALDSGMIPVWLPRRGELPGEGDPIPEHQLNSVLELESWIETRS